MEVDGFSLDDKRQKIAENDIPDIIAQWCKRHPERQSKDAMRKAAEPAVEYALHASTPSRQEAGGTALSMTALRSGKCFLVPADEIRANKYDLSISRYKQIDHKEIEYEKPDIVMAKVLVLEKDIANDIEEIKSML